MTPLESVARKIWGPSVTVHRFLPATEDEYAIRAGVNKTHVLADLLDDAYRRGEAAGRAQAASTASGEPNWRELLIEALARLDAVLRLPGDPGGPYYVFNHSADELATATRWINALASEPPGWDDDDDGRDKLWSLTMDDDELWNAVEARSGIVTDRMKHELEDYHLRRGDSSWKGWWRGAQPVGGAV